MSTKYIKPSRAQRYVQRYKRNAPPLVVDVIDFMKRVPPASQLKYPYSDEQGYQPFFIIGCGRSGNTLLRKLLLERLEVAIPPELPGIGSTIRCFSQVGCRKWPEIVELVLNKFCDLADVDIPARAPDGTTSSYNLRRELSIDFNTLGEELLELNEKERSLAAIVSKIYEVYSINLYGRKVPWGDKTPWNVFHYHRIKKVFPNARYIHMLRDGRACVASYVRSLGEQKNISLEDAAHRWKDSVSKCVKVGMVERAQFLTVRYEDLVSNTTVELDRVINFLQIAPRVYQSKLDFQLGDDRMPHHSNLSKPVNTNSIGRWKNFFSRKELERIESIIGPILIKMGYKLE